MSAIIDADPGPFAVSPYVVAELDYLLATRRRVDADVAVLDQLTGGARELLSINSADLRDVPALVDLCRDQEIGIADASLVMLANRYRTNRMPTLDLPHFRVVRKVDGRAFTVLPEQL
ncbi:MAG: type II toxin-antitoxin system toxin ribonuclease C26 [Candidatus Dormibacteria bacterium]